MYILQVNAKSTEIANCPQRKQVLVAGGGEDIQVRSTSTTTAVGVNDYTKVATNPSVWPEASQKCCFVHLQVDSRSHLDRWGANYNVVQTMPSYRPCALSFVCSYERTCTDGIQHRCRQQCASPSGHTRTRRRQSYRIRQHVAACCCTPIFFHKLRRCFLAFASRGGGRTL